MTNLAWGSSRMRGKGLKAWALAGVAMGAVAVPASAQMVAPPPPRQSVDQNGVDLFLGTLNVASPKVSMGDDETGLSYYFLNTGSGWTDNVTAALDQSGSLVTVRLGASTDDFTASGTTYTSKEGRGSTLTVSNGVYTYTATDGTIAHFQANTANTAPYYAGLGRASDITSPSGKKLVYSYVGVTYCASAMPNEPDVCRSRQRLSRLASITNSYGYQLRINYVPTDPEDPADTSWRTRNLPAWSTVTGTTLVNVQRSPSPNLSVSTSASLTAFTVTDPAGRTTGYRQNGAQVLGITRPGSTVEEVTIAYNGNRVSSVTNAGSTWTYGAPSDSGDSRTVTVTDPSNQTTRYVFSIASQRMTSMTDPLGRVTSWSYDGLGRLTRAIAPEGNSVEYAYDGRGNVVSTTVHAKPNTGKPDITATAYYDPSCTNAVTCNQPVWTRDALNNQTDYAYDPTHGGVTAVTLPAPTANAVRPQVRTSYTDYTDQFGGTVYRATSTSTCRTGASCANTADETVTSINYGSLSANNLQPVSTTTRAGDNSVVATSSVAYDAVGNAVSSTDPRGAVTTYQYDADRWPVMAIGPDPDGSGPMRSQATAYAYDGTGRVTRVSRGTANSDGSGFSEAYRQANQLDGYGRIIRQTLWSNGTDYAVTDYLYDANGRQSCSITYMDPSRWGPQASSCAPSQTSGSNGPDRVAQASYDALGRVTQVVRGVGTAQASTERTSYTPNGQTESVTDGNGNRTGYTYDAYDRLVETHYPVPGSPGSSSSSDYEGYDRDVRGNIYHLRLRDGNNVYFGYDALGRMLNDSPSGERGVAYAYDNQGRLTQAAYDGLGGPDAVTNAYDALGRLTASTTTMGGVSRTVSNQYDADGNRTRITHPDGVYFDMSYDPLSRMKNAVWWGPASGAVPFMAITYDDVGRRQEINRASSYTHYDYDAVSRLSGQHQWFAGGAGNLDVAFGYNPAGQMNARVRYNDDYAFPYVNVNRSYAVNGLNQYTSAGPVTFGYDGRGNLTSDGSNSYGYDLHNRLVRSSTSGGATLTYDPLGRLWQTASPVNGKTQFVYDGDHVAVEYDGDTGGIRRRFMWGPGADEPILQDEGGQMNCSGTRFLHTDYQGSIVAAADCWGNRTNANRYDEYGIPGQGNWGRFQYTGQAWLPDLGIYYYKARLYSPTLGRFMQTDPVGYGDGLNWYNYVGGDPINGTDPSGLAVFFGCSIDPRHTTSRVVSQDGTVRDFPAANICIPFEVTERSSNARDRIVERNESTRPTSAPAQPQKVNPNCGGTLPWAPGRVSNAPRTINGAVGRTRAGLRSNVLSGALRGLGGGLTGVLAGAAGGYGQSVADAAIQTRPGGTWATGQAEGNIQYGAVLSTLGIPQFLQLLVGDADETAEYLRIKKPNDPDDSPWDSPVAKAQIRAGATCAR